MGTTDKGSFFNATRAQRRAMEIRRKLLELNGRSHPPGTMVLEIQLSPSDTEMVTKGTPPDKPIEVETILIRPWPCAMQRTNGSAAVFHVWARTRPEAEELVLSCISASFRNGVFSA